MAKVVEAVDVFDLEDLSMLADGSWTAEAGL